MASILAMLLGSSPRVRGTLFSTGTPAAMQGFIPACAGNTGANYIYYALITVHPRVCGEH